MWNRELPEQMKRGVIRAQVLDNGHAIEVGDFKVDPEAHTFTLLGQRIRLTPLEFELLLHFVRNSGRVLTHQVLSKVIWGDRAGDRRANLRVMVGQLRQKLGSRSGKQYLQTEPWLGYRFLPDGFSK